MASKYQKLSKKHLQQLTIPVTTTLKSFLFHPFKKTLIIEDKV